MLRLVLVSVFSEEVLVSEEEVLEGEQMPRPAQDELVVLFEAVLEADSFE